MTSLRHRPTTVSRTDIVPLVRRALAEVCTVPVLLALTDIIGYDRLKFYIPQYEILGTPLPLRSGRT